MAGTGKAKRRPNTEYITDKSARKVCFNKRKKGLLKKLTEVTTLCDVEGCAIVYNHNEEEPVLFPAKDVSKVTGVISKFKSLPEEEQTKNMLTQETFLREKIAKAEEQLTKLRAENKEKKFSGLMCEYLVDPTKSFNDLSMSDLQDLAKVTDNSVRQVDLYLKSIASGKNFRPPVPDVLKQLAPLYPTITSTTLRLSPSTVGEDVKPSSSGVNGTASDE